MKSKYEPRITTTECTVEVTKKAHHCKYDKITNEVTVVVALVFILLINSAPSQAKDANTFCSDNGEVSLSGEITQIGDQDKQMSGDFNNGVLYDLSFKSNEGKNGVLSNISAPVTGGLSVGSTISFVAKCESGSSRLAWEKWTSDFLKNAKSKHEKKQENSKWWAYMYFELEFQGKKIREFDKKCEGGGSPAGIMKTYPNHKIASEIKNGAGEVSEVTIQFHSNSGPAGYADYLYTYYYSRDKKACEEHRKSDKLTYDAANKKADSKLDPYK